MKKVNSWINRKMIVAQGCLQSKTDAFVQKVVPTMSAKKECQTVLHLTRVLGVSQMRDEVVKGFAAEWATKTPDEIDAEIRRYRDEPLFEKVMGKLMITWPELESMAAEVKQ